MLGDDPFGCTTQMAKNGAMYVRIHYSADPGKRSAEWKREMRRRIGAKEWEREMEMNEDIWDGHGVFASDFIKARHCPPALERGHLPILTDSVLVGGWDCGNTLSPAFVLTQTTASAPHQTHALAELISPHGAPMSSFAPLVNQLLIQLVPTRWSSVYHVADETCDTRQGARGETASDVAAEHGITLHAISNVWAGRYSAVQDRLLGMIDEDTPQLLISGAGCPTLLKGFEGAYKYMTSASGDEHGAGTVLLRPLKNSFSHVHDAFQAAMIEVKDRFYDNVLSKRHGRLNDFS